MEILTQVESSFLELDQVSCEDSKFQCDLRACMGIIIAVGIGEMLAEGSFASCELRCSV